MFLGEQCSVSHRNVVDAMSSLTFRTLESHTRLILSDAKLRDEPRTHQSTDISESRNISNDSHTETSTRGVDEHALCLILRIIVMCET